MHALLSQSAAVHRASAGNLSAAAVTGLAAAAAAETVTPTTTTTNTASPDSRPASYISVEESSGPETSEKNHESEDDGKLVQIIGLQCLKLTLVFKLAFYI